jgi:TolB-like protein/DNA-binding SARP family transcriptional activator/tetratricopeptide (TPR) repeat protein/tRNA A-37 threonylcarbamoyl transferase component Bud32
MLGRVLLHDSFERLSRRGCSVSARAQLCDVSESGVSEGESAMSPSLRRPPYRLLTLGVLQLVAPAGEVLVLGRRELVLLAYLARRAPKIVRRDELAALLWREGEGEAGAQPPLDIALAKLQRVLGSVIDAGPEEVRLEPGAVTLDAWLFEQEIAKGQLAAAAARWEGEFLAGTESVGVEGLRAWLQVERRGLRRGLLWTLERLLSEHTDRGEWDEAIRWAMRWAEVDPWDERAHRKLVETLRRAGRIEAALARQASFSARIRQELARESLEYQRDVAHGPRAPDADSAMAAEVPATRDPGSAMGTPAMGSPVVRSRHGDIREELYRALGGLYTLEQELTSGSMSRVFVAEETRFRRRVVIKVLNPELAVGLSAERFEREIMLAAALQDAHIVPVLGGGHVNGLPYYTMPFVDGQSLRSRLQTGHLPLPETLAILRDVAMALEYAHGQGVVHRDIKPDNVLLSSGGRTAVVTDFGIAKAMSASKMKAGTGAITLEGYSVGTPEYIAPEQARAGIVDARADLYSWGVMAYEMLTDHYPWPDAKSPVDFLTAHVSTPPSPLPLGESGIPAGLAALVMRCLEKSPARRPQSASELLAELESVRLTGSRPRGRPARPRRRATATLLVLAAAGLVAWLVARSRVFERTAGGTGNPGTATDVARAAIPTVAVLPFVNTSGDATDEYFSDGMTDELAHALARLPSLRVAGRMSSYAFKSKQIPPQQIGKLLNVAGVVAGTVRRSGDRVRVTAELTNTADGMVVWSDTYESRGRDLFEVQDEFTGAIVAALAPSLRGLTSSTLAGTSRGTTDAEAYDLYLRGQFFWAKRGTQNVTRAAGFFRRAIERDPSFARAFAGLALVNSVASYYQGVSGDSAYRLTLPMAARALALDSTSAEAHLALGTALFHRGRFEEAKARYRAGLALDPNNAFGHMWLGDALFATGSIKDALAEQATASAIDPLSAPVASARAEALYVARRFPEAMVVASRMRDLDSTYTHALNIYARVFVFGGAPDSAISHLEANLHGAQPDSTLRPWLAVAYAGAGRRADAERVLTSLRRGKHGAPDEARMAIAELALGMPDSFFGMLDDGTRENALVNLGYFGCDPMYDEVRQDPRYLAAARRHGVSVCSLSTASPFARARR